ncbi:ESCRT-II complex subunit domain-containing protein [Sarocladium implicatum]|nr:ESCRT-II complex subunit domain-containing protein [Sarocladium implicatum]
MATTPFTFPPEHNFPPFFTPQPNTTTHHAQLLKWSSLLLAYTRHHRIFRLSLVDLDTPLFHNKSIDRRLSQKDVKELALFMQKDGKVEFVRGGGGGGGGGGQAKSEGDVVFVYWRTLEEWAQVVEGWVDETGQKGGVLTVYELTQGDATRGTELHGLDTEILLKALNILVKRGKAQIFGEAESQGVKFF